MLIQTKPELWLSLHKASGWRATEPVSETTTVRGFFLLTTYRSLTQPTCVWMYPMIFINFYLCSLLQLSSVYSGQEGRLRVLLWFGIIAEVVLFSSSCRIWQDCDLHKKTRSSIFTTFIPHGHFNMICTEQWFLLIQERRLHLLHYPTNNYSGNWAITLKWTAVFLWSFQPNENKQEKLHFCDISTVYSNVLIFGFQFKIVHKHRWRGFTEIRASYPHHMIHFLPFYTTALFSPTQMT